MSPVVLGLVLVLAVVAIGSLLYLHAKPIPPLPHRADDAVHMLTPPSPGHRTFTPQAESPGTASAFTTLSSGTPTVLPQIDSK